MSQQNLQVINTAYEAFGRGDIPAVLAQFHEDVEWYAPDALPHGGSARGHAEVGEFFGRLASTWSDFGIDIAEVVDGEDTVLGRGQAHGKLSGGESGYGFVHVFTLRDGKVARFDEYVAPPAGGFPS